MDGKPTPIGRITLVTLLILLAGGAAWWLRPAITAGVTSSAQVGSDKAKTTSSQTQPRKDGGARPATVEVSEARSRKASDDVRAIGALLSDESVVLAPEISGRVAEIPLTEGRPIKKGDVLVRLDSELALAEVADAKARLTLAAANNERARILSKTGTVSGRGRDEAVSNFETAQAALALAETKVRKLSLVARTNARIPRTGEHRYRPEAQHAGIPRSNRPRQGLRSRIGCDRCWADAGNTTWWTPGDPLRAERRAIRCTGAIGDRGPCQPQRPVDNLLA